MAVIIPETIIADVIQSGINILRSELKDISINDQDTTLFKYFENTSISSDQYVMFDQMKSLLLIDESDTDKKLKVFQSYTPSNTKVPSVFVHMAGEAHEGAGNALGDGLGEVEFDEDNQEYTDIFEKKYLSRYLIIVISENSSEIIALHHLIRSILISSSNTTALSCLENFKVRSASVDLKQKIDFNLFYRTLEVTFEYPIKVPDFTKNKYYLQCTISGTPIKQ